VTNGRPLTTRFGAVPSVMASVSREIEGLYTVLYMTGVNRMAPPPYETKQHGMGRACEKFVVSRARIGSDAVFLTQG
jgi:hypothetical protein